MRLVFSIVNKGKEMGAEYAPIFEELSVTDCSTEQSDCVRIRLSDIGGTIALPVQGEQIRVAFGEAGNIIDMGIYVIDGVEMRGPPDVIEITGSACPFDSVDTLTAMQTRVSRSWDDVTLGELVEGIAGEHGLTAAVSQELAAIQIPHLDQTAESSMNLLTRLARDYDAVFKPTFGRLVFTRAGEGKGVDGKELPTYAIARGPGTKYTAILSKRSNFDCAKASYHNLDNGQFEDYTEGLDAESKKLYMEGRLSPTPQLAKARAWSRIEALRRGSKIVTLDFPGLHPVTAEQKVSLSGFRAQLNTTWIAKRVVFTLNRRSGLRTRLDCEIPGMRAVVATSGKSDPGTLWGVSNQGVDGDLPEDPSMRDVEDVKSGVVPGGLPEAQEPGAFSFDEDGLPS